MSDPGHGNNVIDVPVRIKPTSAARCRVVIAGGGVAALECLIALRTLAGERVELELISPERTFAYRPLAVAAAFGANSGPSIDLQDLAWATGAAYASDAIAAVNPAAAVVTLASGRRSSYDVLVMALGARPVDAIPGAIAFGTSRGTRRFRSFLAEAERGRVSRIAFAVPGELAWPLPLYELGLLTAERLNAAGMSIDITLLTPEPAPLAMFGSRASDAVLEELEEARIHFRPRLRARELAWGALRADPGDVRIGADAVVTVPALRGPAVQGLPADDCGFLPVDAHCLVRGTTNVYGAGDAIAFPIKHGALASQQADAAAEAIAAGLGIQLDPVPFRPTLRGLLVTGGQPRYLEAKVAGEGTPGVVSSQPLWWPPAKVACRYLAPYLTGQVNGGPTLAEGIPVELDLQPEAALR